jgi:hypothetical protein
VRSAASSTGPSAGPRSAGQTSLDRGQGDAGEQRDRKLAALDVALEQHAVVVGERRDQRLRYLGGGGGKADTERGTSRGGLDHERKAESILDLAERIGGAELAKRGRVERDPVRGCYAGRAQRVLGGDLVDRASAGRDAGAGVGDVQDLEDLLDGAVLAADPVQGDEGDLRALGLQGRDQAGADIDREHVVTERSERVLDPRAAAQRHLALEPAPALEHRDLHCSWRRNGTTSPDSSSARP